MKTLENKLESDKSLDIEEKKNLSSPPQKIKQKLFDAVVMWPDTLRSYCEHMCIKKCDV